MLFAKFIPKSKTKYVIFALTVAGFGGFNFQAASAATLPETTSTTVTATPTVTSSPTVKPALTAAQKKAAIKAKKKAKAAAMRKKIIAMAKKNRGIRYVYGGTSPSTGFDCSGFTKYVFKKAAKINLPHSANAQSKLGKRISKKNAKPGDLVIYSYPFDRNFHVAIYLNKKQVIHAKKPGQRTQIGPLDWGGSETRIYVDVVDKKVGL